MKQILVPTDFSSCANNALDFAVQSAIILPAEIILLHAFELKGNIYTDYLGVAREFSQTFLHEVEDKLAEIKLRIEKTEGIIVDTYVFTGTVKESILQVSAEKNIDLIVMGTLGAGIIKEKLWGNKTASIIGNSKVPVMVIPDEYEWKKPQKILLATHHFEEEPAVLDFLFELADLYMAQVHVSVFTDEDDDNAETFIEHSIKFPHYEKMLKEQYREETLTATNLFGKEFEKTLQDYIKQNEIDILTMVTYQRKFLDRIFHPSMTKQMSYHTKIPLLAIPAK